MKQTETTYTCDICGGDMGDFTIYDGISLEYVGIDPHSIKSTTTVAHCCTECAGGVHDRCESIRARYNPKGELGDVIIDRYALATIGNVTETGNWVEADDELMRVIMKAMPAHIDPNKEED